MHRILKKAGPLLRLLHTQYLKKPRPYRYGGIRVVVNPGVFFPRFIFSTRIMLDYLNGLELSGKNVLDLGAGCGILGLLAASKGARVVATDISPLATENIRQNAARSHLTLDIIRSDLFESIPRQPFDWILVTPPYYPKDPVDFPEMAWYCGKEFGYFVRLFPQLKEFISPGTEIRMILSEDCNFGRIRDIAAGSGWEMTPVLEKKSWGEKNFIYRITLRSGSS
ncbi:MAG TPA: methyltransferase [Bacteroidales bacterium]|nr:methyltransferase [Bacteroidales bacterium]